MGLQYKILQKTDPVVEVDTNNHASFLTDTEAKTLVVPQGGSTEGISAGTAVRLRGLTSTDVTIERNGSGVEVKDDAGQTILEASAATGTETTIGLDDGLVGVTANRQVQIIDLDGQSLSRALKNGLLPGPFPL